MAKKNQSIIFDWKGTLADRNGKLFLHSKKVVEELGRRFKIGLISLARDGMMQRYDEIVRSGIAHYTDVLMVVKEKSQGIFMECMESMRASPEITHVVDDRAVRGIKVGNDLGCTTYWIMQGLYSNQLPNEDTGEPDYRIKSVRDLLTLI